MASTPSYDPNQLASHDTSEANGNYSTLSQNESNPMLNRVTSQLYPPGSTFKTVVAAAALETGEYQTDTEIPAGSSYTLPGTATQLTNAVSQADGSDDKITLEDAMAYFVEHRVRPAGRGLWAITKVVVPVAERSLVSTVRSRLTDPIPRARRG